MTTQPHTNEALWTHEDVEVMLFRMRRKCGFVPRAMATRYLSRIVEDDRRESRLFHELRVIGHCRCHQCAI